MTQNQDFQFVNLSYEELKNLKLHKINRCGEINKENCPLYYRDGDYDDFINRCNRLRKEILKKGYNPTSQLIIAKCVEDGEYYLIEGQGRRGAILIGTENGDFSIDKIPCMIFNEPLTYDRIGKEILRHNQQKPQNPWKTNDIDASRARQYGGDVEEAYKFQCDYQERIGMRKHPYMARLMIYGQKGSHSRDTNGLTSQDYRPDYKLFMELYEYFLNNFVREEWRGKYKTKVRNQNIGIIYESFFQKLYRETISFGLNPYEYLPKVNKILCKWSQTAPTYNLDTFFSFKKSDKSRFLDLTKIVPKIKDIYPSNININISDDWAFSKF